MIAELKPYPEYRQAKSGWLGEVPSHWTTMRMKYVVSESDERSTTGKEQLLRISQYTGVTQRRQAAGLEGPDTRADSLIGYKRVEPSDLVINIMLAWNGSMGVSRYEGIASPAYCVYRFGRDFHPWYFHNLLRSPAYKAEIKASSTGVVDSRLRLYSDDLGRIEAIIPPLDEQASIVRFLDWANGRIDQAIRAKRKVIMLLNEQKEAMIHRAVTRGLDPSAPRKPSGIPWLGEIPKHWEVARVCRLFRQVIRYTAQGDEPKMSMSRHYGLIRSDQLSSRAAQAATSIKFSVCQPGDLVLNKYQAHNGLFGAATERGLITSNYSVFEPASSAFTEFYALLFASPIYRAEFRMRCQGVGDGMMPLYSGAFLKTPTMAPPVTEQRSIVAFIAESTKEVAQALSRLAREIELLREYRTRLVADVVTGKLDVREAAARLPDDAPLDTIEDDVGLGEEAETADEEAAV